MARKLPEDNRSNRAAATRPTREVFPAPDRWPIGELCPKTNYKRRTDLFGTKLSRSGCHWPDAMSIPSTSQPATSTWMQSSLPKARNLTDVFDILAQQAQSKLGTITQAAYFIGDGLQRAITDGVFDLFQPQTWTPTNLLRLGSAGLQELTQISRLALPGNASLAWEELKNKLEVFILVKNLPDKLNLPAAETGEFIPLAELVLRAYDVPPFQALWAVEGLGHYYADSYYAHYGNPQGLLLETEAQVPDKSLLMLHAGMGLSFAYRLLGNLRPDDPSPSEAYAAVEEFVDLCRKNSRDGYLGAAVESFGLVTRDFYPELLNLVHKQFQQIAPELTGFFWHGAGRALYFSRQYFLPVLTTASSGIRDESRNFLDEESAMSGLSWAITLVNMRQPRIMEASLLSYLDSGLAKAFINGITSSLIMRQDTTPEDPYIVPFLQYRPDPDNSRLAEAWMQSISGPGRRGLQEFYPVLKQHRALEQVFRYQDLTALVADLQGSQANAEPNHFKNTDWSDGESQ